MPFLQVFNNIAQQNLGVDSKSYLTAKNEFLRNPKWYLTLSKVVPQNFGEARSFSEWHPEWNWLKWKGVKSHKTIWLNFQQSKKYKTRCRNYLSSLIYYYNGSFENKGQLFLGHITDFNDLWYQKKAKMVKNSQF